MSSSISMEGAEESPTKIMIAVSQSSVKGYPHASLSSINAFHWTLKKLVKACCKHLFKLQFLHVSVPDEDDDFKDMKNRENTEGLHLLEYFVKHCNEIGVPCEAWIRRGDPKVVICQEVQRVHPDILILGSRGLGPVQRIFVGTVSDYCAKHADCPVIVVKRKVEDTPEDPVDD